MNERKIKMSNSTKTVTTDTNNKPLSLVREDFIKDVVELINNTPLPPFIMESALRDICNTVSNLAKQMLEKDREEYNRQNNA